MMRRNSFVNYSGMRDLEQIGFITREQYMMITRSTNCSRNTMSGYYMIQLSVKDRIGKDTESFITAPTVERPYNTECFSKDPKPNLYSPNDFDTGLPRKISCRQGRYVREAGS